MIILQHNWQSNSYMFQLLQDPETLPFNKGKNINLSVLRKEINRRVIKIKKMLGCNQFDKKCKLSSCGCQTQNIQLNGQTIKQRQVLSPKKSTENLPMEQNQKALKYTGRCSLPVRKLNEKIVGQNELRKSTRVRVSQYLLRAKAKEVGTFKQNIQRVSSKKKISQPKQDEETAENTEFDFFNSFKNTKKKSELYVERTGSNQMPLPLVFANQDLNLAQFDSEDSELQYVRSYSAINKTMSAKKMKFTQRTALEQEKRFVLAEDIIQKMNNDISKLITKKRRQMQDNKLRENIFKKIEQKYGDYFDNI